MCVSCQFLPKISGDPEKKNLIFSHKSGSPYMRRNPYMRRTHLKPNYGSNSHRNSGWLNFSKGHLGRKFFRLCGTMGMDCTFTQVSMQFLALRNAATAASSEGNQYALTKLQHLCWRRVLHINRSDLRQHSAQILDNRINGKMKFSTEMTLRKI